MRTVGAGGVGSRANSSEAVRAVSLAKRLARQLGEGAVAILSWYNSQVAKVTELLRKEGLSGIHVGSIATAQGSEWDYVILSTVRSDRGGRLGLLSDPHTMNVAITRARHGMVVLCEEAALQEDSNWSALLRYAHCKGLVTTREPEVLKPKPLRRPLTDEEAFDEEQEKLSCLLQSLLGERKEEPKDVQMVQRDKDEKAETIQIQNAKNPKTHQKCSKPRRSQSSKSSSSSRSSHSSHSSHSSSRSRSPRESPGSVRSEPQKRPINALFSHVERVSGA